MSRPPFQPIGPVARWKTIYGMMQPLKVGEILTYAAIAEALDLHPDRDRHTIQMTARRAMKELLNVDHRASQAITNVGYRVAKPVEHLGLAEDRNRKAGKQLAAGHAISTKVDLNGMDAETRKALTLLAQGFARQQEINRRVAEKQQQHDEAIDLLTRRLDQIERGKP